MLAISKFCPIHNTDTKKKRCTLRFYLQIFISGYLRNMFFVNPKMSIKSMGMNTGEFISI